MNKDFLSNKKIISAFSQIVSDGDWLVSIVDTANYNAITFAVTTPPGTTAEFTSLDGVKLMESDNADMSSETEVSVNKLIGKVDFKLVPTVYPPAPAWPSQRRIATLGAFSTKRYLQLHLNLVSTANCYVNVTAILDALVVPV